MKKIRPIAIHLPQFHPIPENDEWWGKGFTEWTNVTRALPLFPGHNQPHLPADLGYYDLRLEESRVAQAILAQEYGIYGFCYYHYWFNGKRLLERPLDDMLKTQTPKFPFMLCWANENWTRRWDGNESQVLMKQDYSPEDHRQHASFLCNSFFKDERYIKIDGKPVMIFYKAQLITDLKPAIEVWRKTAHEHGYPGLYLLCMDNFIPVAAETLGFDGAVHFHPDFRYFKQLKRKKPGLLSRAMRKLKMVKQAEATARYLHHVESYEGYNEAVATQNHLKSKNVFPGITPGWDNTARKSKNGIILTGSTPATYAKYLKMFIEQFEPRSEQENFIFINAWNEWAEGNHLEPCQKWGLQYLEKTKEVLKDYK